MQKSISRDIFEGAKDADILSFFDSHPFNALDLFTSYLCRRNSSSASLRTFVHFLCLEHDSVYWKKRLGTNTEETRWAFLDFTDDFFGWDNDKPMLISEHILEKISQSASSNNTSGDHLVAIDSTTSLLLSLSVTELASLLARIPKVISDRGKPDCRSSIVLLHHADLFDHQAERVLRALSSSCITLTSVGFSKSEQQECICQVHHQQHQESFKKQVERITISKHWKTSFDLVSGSRGLSSGKAAISQRDSETDPTGKLSFNLQLKDSEKVARSQVQLPHTKGGRVIYYEPDEADDIDYEDPDE
ncbi:hypothetical protein RvY_01713 [Ramazzottius varieornatus]|uniref:Elongator complex protein 5 n=1 Tax=Ramazzottius varieornatus TaxID=947166 RepID=A0A1D1UL44_RAMVA|nr:hypothetical protein RvY_01713 [Ramazzottius varieornatus]